MSTTPLLAASVLAIVFLVISWLAMASASASPTCDDIFSEMQSCLPYLRGEEAEPSINCCDGVRYVGGYLNSNEDREAVCECLSQAAALVGDVQDSILNSLPDKCQVSLNLPPFNDGSLDCTRME